MDAPPRRYRNRIVTLRERWGLSQAQLARLLMTSVRAVRRWEDGEDRPTAHQRWFLQLFAGYVERNGVRAFRRRFVREAPRYAKPGRPTV